MNRIPALSPDFQAICRNEHFERELAALGDDGLVLARVAKATRRHVEVWTNAGETTARVPKRVFRAPLGAPVVGDWVALEPGPSAGDAGSVAQILTRQSSLSRRAAGRAATAQVVAANVHTAFVMVGLDGDFNLRRIERYLALAWQGGVEPVVLLNKADLHAAPGAAVGEVLEVASGAPVHALSAKRGAGLEALAPYLVPARTIVVLGSSGVGKSTLVNHLLGEERMRTKDVRARDDRGRHTTTHRELIPLHGGALLIDTPGMRELGLFDHGDGVREAFADVEVLAAACRFADCSHDSEPGCAIREAIRGGELDPLRLASYRKLNGEIDVAALRRERAEREAKQRAYTRLRRKGR